MAEREKEINVHGAAVALYDAVLKDPKWSKILSLVVGCGVLLVICPTASVLLLITLTIARTSAWAIWLGVGAAVGVSVLLTLQWLRRRRVRIAAGGEA